MPAFSRSHALRGNACMDAPRPAKIFVLAEVFDAERRGMHSFASRGNEKKLRHAGRIISSMVYLNKSECDPVRTNTNSVSLL